ncbi:MAG: glycosyltransferase [Terracidiphilus sp.]
MKILHFIPSVDPAAGGPAEGLKQFCSIYRMGGHEVEVASLDSPEVIEQVEFPAKVFGLGPGRGVYGYSPHALPWLKANVRSYDVVLINCIWQYNAVAAYRALKGTGKPYAVLVHGMLDPYFKHRYPLKHLKKSIYWHTVLRQILANAAGVLFTCEEEKILARQSFSRYKVREMVVSYGSFGPDTDLVAARDEFLERWPHLRGKRLAVTLGRIHPKKGTDILIEAFAATLAKDEAWRLVIAGPDQIGWQKELEALAAKLGVGGRITWTGMLKGAPKWGALAASEVFLLPSHQENFGIAVAEALACRLPVILSTKVNTWREIVGSSAGFAGDDTLPATTASFERWMTLSGDEIAAMRQRARECFDRCFNFETTARRTLEIVQYVAAQGRPE